MIDPGTLIIGAYDWRLVALSIIVAILASYTALDLAGRVTATKDQARQWWLFGGACAMGGGIWSMHFIGMLAFSLPIPIRYDVPMVAVSLFAAIGASLVALYIVSREVMTPRAWWIGSVCMGSGIGLMHYIGMFAVRLRATLAHDKAIVALSVLIAVTVALVALRLAFHFRKETKTFWGWERMGSAVLMGLAIPGLHYTAMAGAQFTATSAVVGNLAYAVDISLLGTSAITIGTIMILGLTLVTSLVDRRFQDQTLELERSNRELIIVRDQAMESLRLKSEFLATMSHEIRTPMNGVIGMTELLLETPLTSEQGWYAEVVRSSADALLHIINDILDFSKIEAGKLEFETLDFDLRVAVEEVLDLLVEKAVVKNLDLVGLVFADVPTALRGDPGRVRQILLNLVDNAIKFTEVGEVTVQVLRIEESQDHVTLRFQVVDTGVGIAPGDQERLFHTFTQADSSTTRKYGGTGLGLTICKQLVEGMHGQIGLESAPGQGSLFWFTIQLAKQSIDKQNQFVTLDNLQGVRVCLVDDHETNRSLLAQYCLEWGMEVIVASSPREALALLHGAVGQHKFYDLAILDMEMPGMDGLALAKIMKTDPSLSQVRLVLLTSLGRQGDGQLAQEAGFSGYLTKPIRKSQLRACIQLVMGLDVSKDTLESPSLITRHTVREAESQFRARLLVADDHTINQQLAVLMLERMGHQVDVVSNGKEAVDAVARKRYDAVLMDCQMPEMDGHEATREIRKHEASFVNGEPALGKDERPATSDQQRLPIIAMTANAMQGDREKCLAAGMDDYVAKPITFQNLVGTLARWLPMVQQEGDAQGRPRQEIEQDAKDRQSYQNDQPSLDEAVLAELESLGGMALIAKIVKQFIRDATSSVDMIQQAVVKGDADALGEVAHGLKGICGNIGAGRLSDIACDLEQQGKAKSIEGAAGIIEKLHVEFERVEKTLQEKIATFTN